MKKISTKIVILTIANSLLISIVSQLVGNLMRSNGSVGNAAGTPGAGGELRFLGMPSFMIVGTLVSIVIGAIIAYFFGRYISKPILEVTKITKRTADLDLVYEKSFDKVIKYKDECGAMARALEDTRKSLRDMAGKLNSISSSLASHSQNLTEITDENVKSITQVASTLTEIAEGNGNQARTINEINSTLTEVVGLIDDITNKTLNGADEAVKSLEIINEGQKAVGTSFDKMKQNIAIADETEKSVEELSDMIKQVSGIVSVITSIADQTNLLSLNAAIEAARVGEAGKGFAVVAEEIRKLAEETSSEAKKITGIVQDTTEKANLVVENMNKTSVLVEEQKDAVGITRSSFVNVKDAYDNIVNNLQSTATAIKTINEKSNSVLSQIQDMSAVAEESAASTEEVSASGQQQLASIETIAQSSKELSGMADELSREIGRFRL